MNEERAKKNMAIIEEHMQAVIKECPELNDAVVVLNWKREEVTKDANLPASMAFSNRRSSNEAHMQAAELARALTDTALVMHERVMSALLEMNNELVSKIEESAKPQVDSDVAEE